MGFSDSFIKELQSANEKKGLKNILVGKGEEETAIASFDPITNTFIINSSNLDASSLVDGSIVPHESASKMEKKIMDSKEIDRAIELLQAMQQGKTIENSNGALMDNFMFGTKNCTCTEPSFCRVRKEPKYRPYTPAEAIGLIGLNVMPKSGVGDILKAMRIDSVTVRDSITTGNITGIVLRPEIQGGREVTVTPDALLKGYTRYGDGAPCGVKLED